MIIIIYINNKSYFFPGITSKGGLSWTRIHALPKLRDLTEFLQSDFPLLDSLHDQIAVIYFYYIALNFKFFNNIHAFKHFILLRSYNLKSKHRVFWYGNVSVLKFKVENCLFFNVHVYSAYRRLQHFQLQHFHISRNSKNKLWRKVKF